MNNNVIRWRRIVADAHGLYYPSESKLIRLNPTFRRKVTADAHGLYYPSESKLIRINPTFRRKVRKSKEGI